MSHFLDFLGRLHPMLVHLPIGILVLVITLTFIFDFQKKKTARLLRFSFGFAALTAVVSACTGLLLSQSGDYDATILAQHQWFGISVAVASTFAWILVRSGSLTQKSLRVTSIVVLLLVVAAGHLGASLTHGSNYLTEPLAAMVKDDAPEIDFAKIDVARTRFYPDVIKPILDRRCVSCHGEGKQKGKLRLDQPEFILKGGKSGKVVEPGTQSEGELLYRLHLSLNDEDHMPPKEKPQLSDGELKLLRLWIKKGCDFSNVMSRVVSKAQLDSAMGRSEELVDIPATEPVAPDWNQVAALLKKGIAITPVAQGSNFLSASFISLPKNAARLMKEVMPLSRQIIWMKLSHCEVNDSIMSSLSSFNLTRLSLDDTKVTDEGVGKLTAMTELAFLNLKGTAISVDGVSKLSSLKKLRRLYLYETKVTDADHEKLISLFPNTAVDFGGYAVPTLAGDTSIVKAMKK
jgi:uncharacterized membrane protein